MIREICEIYDLYPGKGWILFNMIGNYLLHRADYSTIRNFKKNAYLNFIELI